MGRRGLGWSLISREEWNSHSISDNSVSVELTIYFGVSISFFGSKLGVKVFFDSQRELMNAVTHEMVLIQLYCRKPCQTLL